MGLKIDTKRAIQDAVDDQKPFVRGNLSGQFVREGVTMGRLPEEYVKIFRQQQELGLVHFVIYSRLTPIAWVLYSGSWIIPDVKYSVSTTNHQNVVRTAIDNFDYYNKLVSH